jgi:hypothetical protein
VQYARSAHVACLPSRSRRGAGVLCVLPQEALIATDRLLGSRARAFLPGCAVTRMLRSTRTLRRRQPLARERASNNGRDVSLVADAMPGSFSCLCRPQRRNDAPSASLNARAGEDVSKLPHEAAYTASARGGLVAGFGSAVIPDAASVVRAFVDAAAALGQRLLVVGSLRHALPSVRAAEFTSEAGSSAGTASGGERLLPSHVATVEFAPHGWLFARVACAVHHGGAGTTGAAFRAAAPQLLCPVEYDQFFWAQRAHALGVAPPMLSLAAITTARVQAAMVSDPHLG